MKKAHSLTVDIQSACFSPVQPRCRALSEETPTTCSVGVTHADVWESPQPPLFVQSDDEAMRSRFESGSPRVRGKGIKPWRTGLNLNMLGRSKAKESKLGQLKILEEPLITKLHSRYSISAKQAIELKSRQNIVFLPSSPLLAFWDMCMFICLLATGIFEPYVFVFRVDTYSSEIFYWVSSVFYVADTVLRFFRAQRRSTRDGVVLVTNWREIASGYYRDWMFYIDVISALPVSVVVIACGQERTDAGRLLSGVRMIRLLKFARLPHFLHRLHEISNWSFSALSVIQFGMMSCLVLHWIACLWASLGATEEESWLMHAKDEYGFMEFVDHRDMYLMSLYWSVTVLSSVGFGDITPRARCEFFWAIVCMAIGGTVWAYVVGCICSMATSMDKHRTAYESQMNDVNIMCAERHFPQSLQDRVQNFYQHAKEFMRMQNYHKTIRDLSPALKGEVVNWMYGSCFKRVWYFDVVDERCARLLTEGMKPKMYAPEEVIEDTVDGCIRCLVFLRSGLCVRKKNLLAPGAHWGLDVILGSEEHHDIEELLDTALARSINFVFVLKLGKDTIDHAATLVPLFAQRLRKAHLRMLFWRGAIAASRATQKLQRPKTEITHSQTPAWDKAGRMMAKVVHLDRLLVEAEATGCPDARCSAMRRNSRSTLNLPASVKMHLRRPSTPLLYKTQRHKSSPDLIKLGAEWHSAKKMHVKKQPSDLCPSPLPPMQGTRPSKLQGLSDGGVEVSADISKRDDDEMRKKRMSEPALGNNTDVEIMQYNLSSEDDSIVVQLEGHARQISSKSQEADTEAESPNRRRSFTFGDGLNIEAKNSDMMGPSLSTKSVHLPDEKRSRRSSDSISVKTSTKSPKSGNKSPKSVGSSSCRSSVNGDFESMEALTRIVSEETVQEQLADIREQLADSRNQMEEEIGSLRDDVGELTKLMNQLLERFHAKEKY